MNFSWSIFLDLGLICTALLLATFIRSRVRFFQKFLIPNALLAGFILLPIYNFVAPRLGMGSEGLENLVFHLLNLSFVAMSLRGMGMKGAGRRIFSSSVIIIIQYTLQVIVGFGLTLLFIYTFLPKLFPSFGLLMPLGFGLGPGQAFAIGNSLADLCSLHGTSSSLLHQLPCLVTRPGSKLTGNRVQLLAICLTMYVLFDVRDVEGVPCSIPSLQEKACSIPQSILRNLLGISAQ